MVRSQLVIVGFTQCRHGQHEEPDHLWQAVSSTFLCLRRIVPPAFTCGVFAVRRPARRAPWRRWRFSSQVPPRCPLVCFRCSNAAHRLDFCLRVSLARRGQQDQPAPGHPLPGQDWLLVSPDFRAPNADSFCTSCCEMANAILTAMACLFVGATLPRMATRWSRWWSRRPKPGPFMT